jgi:hypothetical protein
MQNSGYPREWQENGAWLRMFQNAQKRVGVLVCEIKKATSRSPF